MQHLTGLVVHRTRAFLFSRLAFAVGCLAIPSIGQFPALTAATSQIEIRGSVLESDFLRPISEVDVLLFHAAGKGDVVTGTTYAAENALARTTTDASGSFRLSVDSAGTYRVEAKKEGYRQAGSFNRGNTSATTVAVEAGTNIDGIRLILARPGGIEGIVVDEETGSPLAGQNVLALQSFYVAGHRRTLPAGFAATNEKGEFLVTSLSPAEYIIRVRHHPFGPERIVRTFKDEEAKLIDPGHEQADIGISQESPFSVRSGDRVYLGAIRLRRVPFYRVLFSFTSGVCSEQDTVNVAIAKKVDGVYETTADLPCSEPFLIKGLPAGSYRAVAFLRNQNRESQRRGMLDFEITDRNLTLELPLARGVDVEGSVVLPEGAAAIMPAELRLRLQSIGTVLRREDLEESPAGEDGKFHLVNLGTGEKRLEVLGLPENCYVKELRYNDRLVPQERFLLDPSQLSHKLTVIVDDGAGSIRGSVKDADKAAAPSYVVAVRADEEQRRTRYPLHGIEVSTNGEFSLTELPPGEYLIFAVPSHRKPDLENPQTLDTLLRKAQKVTLAPGGTAMVNAPLIPSR